MQGNTPDEEHINEHGECASEIGRLQGQIIIMRVALQGLLDAWPTDSLPPHAICIAAADAINSSHK